MVSEAGWFSLISSHATSQYSSGFLESIDVINSCTKSPGYPTHIQNVPPPILYKSPAETHQRHNINFCHIDSISFFWNNVAVQDFYQFLRNGDIDHNRFAAQGKDLKFNKRKTNRIVEILFFVYFFSLSIIANWRKFFFLELVSKPYAVHTSAGVRLHWNARSGLKCLFHILIRLWLRGGWVI